MATWTLNVTFDIGQVSERLYWTVTDGKTKKERHSSGPTTGLFSFNHNDTLNVTVNAVSGSPNIETVTINDCHLLTRPILTSAQNLSGLGPGVYPQASPYSNSAINSFLTDPNPTLSGTSSRQSWTSDQVLTFSNFGRWETTFFVTVDIQTQDGKTSNRVFTFDPESQVGTGLPHSI